MISRAYLSTRFPLCMVYARLCSEKHLFVNIFIPTLTPEPSGCRQEVTLFWKTTLPRVRTIIDALWTKAKHPWAIQAPFFPSTDKHLQMRSGGQPVTVTSFLSLCSMRERPKIKACSHFIHDNFFECIQVMTFDMWYVALFTWKAYRHPKVLVPVAAEERAAHIWKLVLSHWNTSPVWRAK